MHSIMGNAEGYQQVFLNSCRFRRKCDQFLLNFSGLGFHTGDVYVAFLKCVTPSITTLLLPNTVCHILFQQLTVLH